MPTHKRTPSASAIEALTHGAPEILGRIPMGSNYTFLVELTHEDETSQAIYKPLQGEQPLWDFPDGIYKREIAAYELSVALGWPNIPETIERADGLEFGVGSFQRFVPSTSPSTICRWPENLSSTLSSKTIATFDVLANNADRKSSHCLLSDEGAVYAIDNALTFNAEPKLRTVIWEFAEQIVAPRPS